MLDSRQKAAIGAALALPMGAVALFLGSEPPALADYACGHDACLGSGGCVGVGATGTVNGVRYACAYWGGGSAQWGT
jgi:hypothetical protein